MSDPALDARDAVINDTDLVPPPHPQEVTESSEEDPQTSKPRTKLQIVIQSGEGINMAW